MDDREINLIELALATNIPKGCAETMVRGTVLHQTEDRSSTLLKDPVPDSVSSVLPVNVAYLDGKGNVEPQGTGKAQITHP